MSHLVHQVNTRSGVGDLTPDTGLRRLAAANPTLATPAVAAGTISAAAAGYAAGYLVGD